MNNRTPADTAAEELAESLAALHLGLTSSRTAAGLVVNLPDGTAVRLVPVPTRFDIALRCSLSGRVPQDR